MTENKKSPSFRGKSNNTGLGNRSMMPVEKPKEFKKTLLRLLRYLQPRSKQIVFVAFAAVLSTLFNVISPKLLGDATSSIFESFMAGTAIDFSFIGQLLIMLLFLYAFSSVFAFLQQYIMAGVSQWTIAELRQEVSEKLARLPLQYYDQHSHGDILSRAVNDIDNISASLQNALTQVITSVISVVGIIIMMLIISPLLTVVVLLTVPLSGVVVHYITSISQKHFKRQQEELGNINGHVEEMISGHHIVKAFGYEDKAVEEFDAINDRLYNAGWRAQFISGIMMPLVTFIGNIGYVLVCIVGGLLVVSGNVRIGDVQAFVQYSQQISHPMSQMAAIANMIQTAIASAERIFKLLDEEEEAPDKHSNLDIESIGGSIAFEHVRFGYKKGEPIINDMTIDVKEGQTVAIVGPTGAGKTTLINLLMRFYDVNQGAIRIQGHSLNDFSREQVRIMFAMVLQDTWLFNGTIRDNIAYGKADASEQEIIAAAKGAHADDFIRTLPQGYNTMLGEDAVNLSQGQRQLLTIARAILANPKILILDEATSSVDTRTEMNIQKAMGQLMQGCTSFVIAHRLSTIRDADLILVMNRGDIIEQGTHEQLLKQKGFYADLYNSQFSLNHIVES
ncbi:ABC transporter ATP-binding protein [Desulfuribacillus alkaliarsenatis]|uniref:ABC transporter ATP-binding protein n=1 Tax=Desulfuribacillus alkaliarsenatis TaxID=766136 RepID=UPI000A0343D8|nr:ABC transporter ATP-binding protein [Desulfuribacillus alkaliarsenatis]